MRADQFSESDFKARRAETTATEHRMPHQTLFGTNLNNRLVLEDHDVPFVTLTTLALDEIQAGYTFNCDFVDDAFELNPGLIIPPHNYSWSLFQRHIYTSEAAADQFELRSSPRQLLWRRNTSRASHPRYRS